jgi:ribosome maturation factor RimP
MSATVQRVRDVVLGVLGSLPADASPPGAVELYDVEFAGGTLRVVLDRAGGLDMGTISTLTRSISTALDEADPIHSAYTLEVTSPGLERRLRTAEHFSAAVGERVSFKLRPGIDGDRRFVGEVAGVTDDDIAVTGIEPHGGERVVKLADITRAQVHVDWTPPPKPGRPGAPSRGERAGGSDSDSERTNHSEAT